MNTDFILNIINKMGSGETLTLWFYIFLLDILNNTYIIK